MSLNTKLTATDDKRFCHSKCISRNRRKPYGGGILAALLPLAAEMEGGGRVGLYILLHTHTEKR